MAITAPAVAKLSNDDSHRTTLPVFPVKVKVPDPLVHIETEGKVPATVTGLTVIVTFVVVGVQVPAVVVTVYVLTPLVVGVIITEAVLVTLRSVAGDQE